MDPVITEDLLAADMAATVSVPATAAILETVMDLMPMGASQEEVHQIGTLVRAIL